MVAPLIRISLGGTLARTFAKYAGTSLARLVEHDAGDVLAVALLSDDDDDIFYDALAVLPTSFSR